VSSTHVRENTISVEINHLVAFRDIIGYANNQLAIFTTSPISCIKNRSLAGRNSSVKRIVIARSRKKYTHNAKRNTIGTIILEVL